MFLHENMKTHMWHKWHTISHVYVNVCGNGGGDEAVFVVGNSRQLPPVMDSPVLANTASRLEYFNVMLSW